MASEVATNPRSCENTSNKVVALARQVGIPHLSGKKAFPLGLLIAARSLSVVLATLGLLAAIKAKASGIESPGQEASGGNDRKPVAIVTPQDIPTLPSRRAITPTALQALSGKTCSNCSASPKSKPRMWYIIDGKAYCQDCAPRAASETDVGLATSPLPPLQAHPGSARWWKVRRHNGIRCKRSWRPPPPERSVWRTHW